MDRIGDALEFAYLWSFLPKCQQRATMRRVARGIIDNLREGGIRVDGDDVAIFACGFCIQRPKVVTAALGSADRRWDCCQHASSMMTPQTFRAWSRERRQHCTLLIESLHNGQSAMLYVDRVYLPGKVIVEYVRGIAFAPPVQQRVFAFPAPRILGSAVK